MNAHYKTLWWIVPSTMQNTRSNTPNEICQYSQCDFNWVESGAIYFLLFFSQPQHYQGKAGEGNTSRAVLLTWSRTGKLGLLTRLPGDAVWVTCLQLHPWVSYSGPGEKAERMLFESLCYICVCLLWWRVHKTCQASFFKQGNKP